MNADVRPSTGPSAAFYVIGVLVIVGGIILAAVPFFRAILHINEWLTYVTVPGTHDIELAEPGKYTVYYENRTVVDGKPYSSLNGNPGSLDCHLTDKATGAEVALSVPTSSETYNFGPRSGVAILVFTIDTPGTYTFSAAYPEDAAGPDMIYAVGKGVLKRLFAAILTLAAVGGGSFIVGVAIIVVTALKRSKARRLPLAPLAGPYPPLQGPGG